jgi:uncharacterized membrane protein YkoI
MERKARSPTRLREWTGRILPVLAIALLAAGGVHAKDKKKKHNHDDQAAQAQAGKPGEPANPPRMDDKGKSPDREGRDPPRPAPRISLDIAIEQAEKRHKARVVRAERSEEGGRLVYVLRLLSDERVWTVKVDSESGKED